jgi:hypothetical protein
MNINELWVVEYSFFFDAFGTKKMGDHIKRAQECFHKKIIHPYDVISIHESEEECRKQCSILQNDRDGYPLSVDRQIEEFQKAVDGLKAKS